ncbi:MAG: right-handed parallel beta-helix repeat-containing protein [Flavobacteriales bacterium]|nr:right-handed parallel beta-helix repeat-containing protein [Flavobacteriales bacterium]
MKKLASAVLYALGGTLHATTYHVATTGNNANNGLSLASAWATLQYAANTAVAGDSVLVHPGNYQGFAAMSHSGTANAPIVFQAAGPGVSITSPCSYNNLDGINVENVSWVVIEGFMVNDMPRTGIRTALSDHVTIRYNSCHSNYKWGILTGFAEHATIEHNACSASEDEHGIYVSNSADDPIIRFNHCFGNNANGIHMNGDASLGGDGVISNAQVYGNVIHGNGAAGGSGINCDGVVNSVFYNNLLYGNHASGISLYQIDGGAPSTGNRVYNNTIVNASDARWCVNITEGCTGNQVINNILINQHAWRGSIVVAASALPGFVSDHNLVMNRLSPDGDATILDLSAWQALGHDANSQVVAAQASLFAAPGTDFHLLSGSQPVDAGSAAVSAVVSDDLEGTPRPVGAGYDIGCYENDLGTGLSPMTSAGQRLHWNGEALLIGDIANGRLRVWLTDGRLVLDRSAQAGEAVRVPGRGPWIAVLHDGQGAVIARLKFTD